MTGRDMRRQGARERKGETGNNRKRKKWGETGKQRVTWSYRERQGETGRGR